jgi:hypothetical protein
MMNIALAFLAIVLSGCVTTSASVSSSGAREMSKSLLLDIVLGVEGDLTLITDFPLSDIKRR